MLNHTITAVMQRGEKMNNLKECPFCGSRGILRQKNVLDTWIVECSNGACHASYMIGWEYETAEEAAEAWNRRVENDHRRIN